MPHEVRIPDTFKTIARGKTPEMRRAIGECIRQIQSDTPTPGTRIKKMQGREGIWEARVDRANRITFHVEGGVRVLRNNCNHDILTRNP